MTYPRHDHDDSLTALQVWEQFLEYRKLTEEELQRWKNRALSRGMQVRDLEWELAMAAREQEQAGW